MFFVFVQCLINEVYCFPMVFHGFPPDFPHPFTFKRVGLTADIPVIPTAPINNDSFISANTQELFESLLEDTEFEPPVDPFAENPLTEVVTHPMKK